LFELFFIKVNQLDIPFSPHPSDLNGNKLHGEIYFRIQTD